MNELNLAANKPTGFYAIPVNNKNVLSVQPIQTVKTIIDDYQKQQIALINSQNTKENQKRTVTVNGTGEIKLPPNEIKLTIVISSCKPDKDEAKASVHRRYEYVYQTLRKYKITEANIFVNTSYNRKDQDFEVRCELISVLSDFKVYLQIYNILTEKLDKTVKILDPQMSHTPNRIEALKRQATVQAIRNAKRTAMDIANSVSLQLGKPSEIYQESYKETWGESVDQTESKSINDLIDEKTIKITCNVRVTFDLIKSKTKKPIQ